MSTFEQDVERMLRWYPRRWRQQHGGALISLHMDRAGEAGGNAKLSPEDQAAMRAAGLFERTRHSLPIVSAALGTATIVVGYLLALGGNNAVGNPLWIFAGPLLLSLSLWSLRASHDGRWSVQTVIPSLASAFALLALFGTMNTAILRDGTGAIPSVVSLWTVAALSAAFIGIAVALAAAPSFQRGGMSKDWALTVGFTAGVVGAVPLYLGLLSGLIPAAAGVVLLWLTIRSARRGNATPMFVGERSKLA